jgi:hypothetical protein
MKKSEAISQVLSWIWDNVDSEDLADDALEAWARYVKKQKTKKGMEEIFGRLWEELGAQGTVLYDLESRDPLKLADPRREASEYIKQVMLNSMRLPISQQKAVAIAFGSGITLTGWEMQWGEANIEWKLKKLTTAEILKRHDYAFEDLEKSKAKTKAPEYLTDGEWEKQFQPYMPKDATPEDPGSDNPMIASWVGPPKDIPENRVWTLMDTDEDGKQWIVPGYHYVNRFSYFVTKKPWKADTPWVLWWDDAWMND